MNELINTRTGQKSGSQHKKKNTSGKKQQIQFVDNRNEAASQRKRQEVIDRSLRVHQLRSLQEIASSEKVVQRVLSEDRDRIVDKMYSSQINSTGTHAAIKGVRESSSKISGVHLSPESDSGVFLSDNLNEWESAFTVGGARDQSRIVLPDKERIKKNPSLLPPVMRDNGLNPEQNCDIAAEHELTHLKHRSVNQSKGNNLGPLTEAHFFSDAQIERTVNDLIKEATDLPVTMEGSYHFPVARLQKAKDYIIVRLQYILHIYNTDGHNAEAPAVMRELLRFLEKIDLSPGGKPWHDFFLHIKGLDDDCQKSLEPKPEKKEGFFGGLFKRK